MSSLRSSALAGIRWTLGARIVLQVISWPITLISMRALDPKDYGLLALTMVVIGLITVISDLGLGVALVQTGDLSDEAARAGAGVMMLSGAGCALLLWAVAPSVATWFNEPGVTLLVRVMSLDVLAAAAAALPQVQLERQLRFRDLSLALLISGVFGVFTTLIGALSGLGVWALVAGALVTGVGRSLLQIVYYGRIVWPTMRLGAIRGHVVQCGHIVASRSLWYWHAQSDQIVLGRMLHATALGQFSVASQLAMLPVTKAMDTVNRVALPTLSRLRSGAQGLRAVHTRLLGVTAAYAFIACWGLAAIADGLIPVLLGERWRAVAGLLEVLAIIAPLRMVSAVQNTIATALGAPQAVTKELLLASLLLPAVLMAGASTGDVLLAAKAWAFAYPLVYLTSTWLTASAVGMPLLACLRPIAAPFCAGVMLLATVLAVETLLAPYLHAVVLIGVSVALGALSYGLSLALLSPRTYTEARRLLTDLGRSAKPSHP